MCMAALVQTCHFRLISERQVYRALSPPGIWRVHEVMTGHLNEVQRIGAPGPCRQLPRSASTAKLRTKRPRVECRRLDGFDQRSQVFSRFGVP